MRIVVAESRDFSPAAVRELEGVATVELGDLVDRTALLSAVATADVLWVRLRHRVDEEIMAAANGLRFIASPTTGLDHIDLDAANRRGIEVLSLRGATEFLRDVRATAELTIGLMISILRRIVSASHDAAAGNWDRDRFKGRELRGATVGIVGYGRLGRLVAGYLRSFGARLIAHDPYVSSDEIETVPLIDLLQRSDIVTIHAALTDETRDMIDARALAHVKRGAFLVNTSRGAIVNDAALLDALNDGRIAAAALDVLDGEAASGVSHLPLVDYAHNHENLMITPHIGGCTVESMAATELYLAKRVREALERT